MSNRVFIFDTTLRDGEQSPGCKMGVQQKILVAQQLEKLGIDMIEAGFPIASPGDLKAVQLISQRINRPVIAALARTRPEDIVAAQKALANAHRPRIHTFIATSDVHMKKKLRKSPCQVIEMAVAAIQLAKEFTADIEFSPEDAARTGRDFLAEIVEQAISAGATTINIPDTVGYSNPWEFGELIAFLFRRVSNISQAVISVHCHNDLGNAVANSLAGIKAGARQVECCVLGIGERAGNAQLEAVVMNLTTRHDFFGVEIGVDTTQLGPTARLVSSMIGKPIADTSPVSGGNAFGHGAGVHQDGVIKDRRTYEIMTPESVGWSGESLPLVKHSGRAALKNRLQSLGYTFDDPATSALYQMFIELADVKTYVYNDDLQMLVQEFLVKQNGSAEHLFDLPANQIRYSRLDGRVQAFVNVSRNGITKAASGEGDGAVAAIFTAIKDAVFQHGVELPDLSLEDYSVIKGSGGEEAVGWVVVRLASGGHFGYARSANPDVVVASAKAYLYAINHLLQAPVCQATDGVGK